MSTTTRRKATLQRGERRVNGISFVVMTLLAVLMMIPIYYLLVTTFKTPAESAASPMGLPSKIDFSGYVNAWNVMEYPRAFANTAFITVVAVLGTIVFAAMAGYVLNRKAKSRLATITFLLFLSGLMFPYQMGIMGMYSLIRSMGLMDTHWAVILINIAVNTPFAIFLFYAFTGTIPKELEEAAEIDGAGVFRRFVTIIFPLLRPVVVTVAILTTLNVWNDFMGPLYFLQSREKQVILQEVYRNVGQFSTDWTAMFPMMVLGVLPLLLFYVIMQRYIIGGVIAGALKG
ncbi:carbohydrate ABC transporter permease [Microbacterium sp. USHLN186]|uniref:carbohydrate ABC transporter permease n=1 Tax=Microbacterium sp. USHLN186 TaxID=3081286 RepID=UPI003018EE1E